MLRVCVCMSSSVADDARLTAPVARRRSASPKDKKRDRSGSREKAKGDKSDKGDKDKDRKKKEVLTIARHS